jgi:hypothetical protein
MEPLVIEDEEEDPVPQHYGGNIPIRLNWMNELDVYLTFGMASPTRQRMDEEKRAIYQAVGKKLVPVVEASVSLQDQIPDQLRPGVALLIEHCRFILVWQVPESGNEKEDDRERLFSFLFDLMNGARVNDAFNYFMCRAWHLVSPRKEVYLPAGDPEYRRKFCRDVRLLLAHDGKWETFKSAKDVKKFLKFPLRHRRLRLEVFHWHLFANFLLRQNALDQSQRRFQVVVVETIDPVWYERIVHYRDANWTLEYDDADPCEAPLDQKEPSGFEEPTTLLTNRPHEEDLLDPARLCFAALDSTTGQMVGYITLQFTSVSPSSLKQQTMAADLFQQKPLEQFRHWIKNQKAEYRGDAGFDVAVINGLHVSEKYRGQYEIAKLLAFHACDFLSRAQPTLGYRLLSTESLAAATAATFSSFGFSHLNPLKALEWLWAQMRDYVTRRAAPLNSAVTNGFYFAPDSLLTAQGIADRLRKYVAKYGAWENLLEKSEIKILLQAATVFEEHVEKETPVQEWDRRTRRVLTKPTLVRNKLPGSSLNTQANHVFMKQPVHKGILFDLYKRMRTRKKESGGGDPVPNLLNLSEPQDTFLFLDIAGQAALEKGLEEFRHRYYIDGSTLPADAKLPLPPDFSPPLPVEEEEEEESSIVLGVLNGVAEGEDGTGLVVMNLEEEDEEEEMHIEQPRQEELIRVEELDVNNEDLLLYQFMEEGVEKMIVIEKHQQQQQKLVLELSSDDDEEDYQREKDKFEMDDFDRYMERIIERQEKKDTGPNVVLEEMSRQKKFPEFDEWLRKRNRRRY